MWTLCNAQTARFKHYSTDEGFTGAAFKTIVQDSIGFLWISSGSGLYRFDGYRFESYKPRMNDTLSLPQELLRRVWVDPQGRLWVGVPDRIARYDRDLDGFITTKVPTGGVFPESMSFENDTIIWIGTANKGLVRHDKNTGQSMVFNPSTTSQKVTVREIKDMGNYLLLGTSNGLWKFHKATSSFSRPTCDPSDSTLIFSGNVSRIFPHDGHYWLWINQELLKVNSRFSTIQELEFNSIHQKFDVEKKFTNLPVIGMEEDANGVFWIATQGLGLVRFDPHADQLRNFRNDVSDQMSLPSDVLNHVMIDREQNVWATTLNKGIVRLNKQSIHFTNHLEGKSATGVVLLKGGVEDYLIVGTNGNGLWASPFRSAEPDRLKFKKVELNPAIKGFESIVELCLGKNRLWLGSLQSGIIGLPMDDTGISPYGETKIYQHHPGNSNTISENFITAFWEGENGHLWAGTYGSGLDDIDTKAEYGTPGSIRHYQFAGDDQASTNTNGVVDLLQVGDHSLFISSFNGLYRLHAFPTYREHSVEQLLNNSSTTEICQASDGTIILGTKNGLYEGKKANEGKKTNVDHYSFSKAPLPGNPFITAIQEDQLGRIWCSSYDGLFYYDRKTGFVLQFRKEDGLPSSRTVSSSGSAQTTDGLMIFANAEGLTLYDPLSLRINATKPKPVVVQLKINNKVVYSNPHSTDAFTTNQSIHTLKELVLDHTQNIIMLEFAAMDLTAPEKNQYAYMLEGFENDWVPAAASNRVATYTNLRPDNYTFKIKASNRDGVWNDNITELQIKVLPPPWKSWWAYALYATALTGLLFIARRSIIQRERLAGKLKLEHLELEKVREIDRTKTNFFANISHEFRTPLTLIQGPVQRLLERYEKENDTKAQLNLIQQNSDRLLKLINQILELARLESGSLKNECVDGDLAAFLKTVVGSFSSFAIQKRISLIQQLPSGTIPAIFDKDKVEKIISNLISNAIKFTPEEGAIIVHGALSEESNGKARLTLRVTDTGRGIPAEQLEKIFERFYQVNEDGNQNAGTGIGLALSKELTEFLGGHLTLESKIGEGSRFTLTLPIGITSQYVPDAFVEAGNHASTDVAAPDASGAGHHVLPGHEKPILLIVEDHVDLRKFIVSCLGSDYQFLEASNGKDGLHKAIEQVPALVLSDVMMPEMDGIEMCNKLKQDYRTNHIPVILLTAKASNDSKLSGLGKGADDYLIKPFNQHELVLKIKNQIATRERMQEKIRLELLSNSSKVKAVSADEVFLERIRHIIETRLGDEHLSVEALADEAGFSRVQLYRKVTALTGISVNEFIRKLRLQRAAQLLDQRWGTVSQVAYEVGFSNLSYFSKCFKDQFGQLPSEYLVKSS